MWWLSRGLDGTLVMFKGNRHKLIASFRIMVLKEVMQVVSHITEVTERQHNYSSTHVR